MAASRLSSSNTAVLDEAARGVYVALQLKLMPNFCCAATTQSTTHLAELQPTAMILIAWKYPTPPLVDDPPACYKSASLQSGMEVLHVCGTHYMQRSTTALYAGSSTTTAASMAHLQVQRFRRGAFLQHCRN